MRRTVSVFFASWLLFPTSAYPWWETGHQIVARIAAARLTPAARTHISRILDVPDTPIEIADALAKGSTWPDEIRKENPETAPWHFIDLTLQDGKGEISIRCKDDNCVTARIRIFAAQLATPPSTSSRWSQRDALRFLLHFVGDIHQPLHTVSDADLGGNCETLDPVVDTAKNLHGLWDGGILTEAGSDSLGLSAELGRQLAQMTPVHQRELAAGTPDEWAWESHELAQKNIYHLLPIPVEPILFPPSCKEAPEAITTLHLDVTSDYTRSMLPVVDDQLMKAGVRLARMLNESL
jgi:nuclease S1